MRPLVIYHGSCYDGFTAAWIAHHALDYPELLPAKYGEPIPASAGGRPVWVVDFSYPRDEMVRLNELAHRLIVLDHHKTAREACETLSFCTFDMERSGCRMTWDHFHPGTEPPRWIQHVEDRDLWRFDFDETPEVHAYIASLPMTLGQWDELAEMPFDTILDRGLQIRRYIETWIQRASQEARVIDFDGCRVVALNVPYQNASEVGSCLLKQHPDCDFAMGWFQRGDGRYQYSLRSRTDFDVSEVAKKFGGGGHPGAAGFDRAIPPEPPA